MSKTEQQDKGYKIKSLPLRVKVAAPEQLLADATVVAGLLSVSKRYFATMRNTGRMGPEPLAFGSRRLWCIDEVQRWVKSGCPGREEWQNNGKGL